MKKLLIAGAGGLGREVYQWVLDIQNDNKVWDEIEFLDDNINALDGFDLSDKMAGTISDYIPQNNEYVICAIGRPAIRNKVCFNLLIKGAVFTNIIHPTALISKKSYLGKGVIICPRAIVFSNVKIGDFVIINSLTTIGHDATIDEGCILSSHCDVMGNVYLEKEVFLGSGARILPYVRVYKKSKVGAGSVVIKDVKENTSVFGNPAKVIYRPNDSK